MEPFRQKGSSHHEAPLFLRVHTAKPLKYEQKLTLFRQKKKIQTHTALALYKCKYTVPKVKTQNEH